jgi:hypothetical protein
LVLSSSVKVLALWFNLSENSNTVVNSERDHQSKKEFYTVVTGPWHIPSQKVTDSLMNSADDDVPSSFFFSSLGAFRL